MMSYMNLMLLTLCFEADVRTYMREGNLLRIRAARFIISNYPIQVFGSIGIYCYERNSCFRIETRTFIRKDRACSCKCANIQVRQPKGVRCSSRVQKSSDLFHLFEFKFRCCIDSTRGFGNVPAAANQVQ